jgi:hypothetical protein
MSDAMPWLIWAGVPAALIIIGVLVKCGEWAAGKAEGMAAHFQAQRIARQAQSAGRIMREQESRVFLEWLAARSGTGSVGSGIDDTIVEAQRQSEMIRILIEKELPKAVRRCLETHRLNAKLAGAYHFSEVAYEPENYRLRIGMVWLLDHAVRFIEQYPLLLDDVRLLHNIVVLRRGALASCRHCPLIEWEVKDAPQLCPTAELVQVRDASGQRRA